jgi:hypothetical protein
VHFENGRRVVRGDSGRATGGNRASQNGYKDRDRGSYSGHDVATVLGHVPGQSLGWALAGDRGDGDESALHGVPHPIARGVCAGTAPHSGQRSGVARRS